MTDTLFHPMSHTPLFLICCQQFQQFRLIADSRSLNGNFDPTIHCCSVNTTTANYCTKTHASAAAAPSEATMLADWVSRFMPASARTIIDTDGTTGFAFIFIFLRPPAPHFPCADLWCSSNCVYIAYLYRWILAALLIGKRFILFVLLLSDRGRRGNPRKGT